MSTNTTTTTTTTTTRKVMQRGSRYRGGRGGRGGAGGGYQRGGRGGSSRSTARGLFTGRVWQCDCEPRQPAEFFQTKKEGKNQGRWFYTCQKSQEKRCGFFLWADDAKGREQAALMNNSTHEPREPVAQEGWSAGRVSAAPEQNRTGSVAGNISRPSPPTPTPAAATTQKNSRKRPADSFLDNDDEEEEDEEEDDAFQPWALRPEDEKALAKLADSSAIMETPRKAQKTGVYATPGTTGAKKPRTIPWLQEPVSPVSNKKKTVKDYFSNATMVTPSKSPPTRTKSVSFQMPTEVDQVIDPEPETPSPSPSPPPPAAPQDETADAHDDTAPAPPTSPSPSRYRDALVNPADSSSSLTSSVLAELSPVRLPPEKISTLRTILSRHDLKTQGVTKGRDISRLALKAKEAKIVELEARVASLEAERRHDRGVIARLKWEKENQQNDDEDEESQFV